MNNILKPIFAMSLLAVSLFARDIPQVDINISGSVTDVDGKALSGAAVILEKAKLSTKTDDKGAFSLVTAANGIVRHTSLLSQGLNLSLHNSILSIDAAIPSVVSITTYSQQGQVLSKTRQRLDVGIHRVAVPSPYPGVYFVKVTSEDNEVVLKSVSMGEGRQGRPYSDYSLSPSSSFANRAKISAAFTDVLKVTKSGYQAFSMNIDYAEKSGVSIQLKSEQAHGPILSQAGNPTQAQFDIYKKNVSKADNILSWQLDCGGWPKNVSFDKKGKGGDGLGTFDNGATTMEITVLAAAYKDGKEEKYLDGARKGLDFIFESQYPSGGWPQFYPLKGNYADHVTFNDDAMSRTMMLLHHIKEKNVPFDTDVFTEEQRSKLQKAIDGGIDYILKAQIVQNGKKTVWCAQHDAESYEPTKARAYEHPSLSGSESIKVIGFLMSQPQTPVIKKAVMDALTWFRSPDTYLADYDTNFKPKKGSRIWFRFYDIPTNKPIFSNYDGVIHLGLENAGKRKGGYLWAGKWGETIISYAEKVGY